MENKPTGVMIVGMKMPIYCKDCPCCLLSGRCKVTGWRAIEKTKDRNKTKRPLWCPLEEVKNEN